MLALKENECLTNDPTWIEKYILYRLKEFQPKVSFKIQAGQFIIKTAETPQEVYKALKLRHEVFIEELLSKSKFFQVDIDKYDFIADHIIVIHKESNTVIATYRAICSEFTKKHYSETEFKMRNFLKDDSVKVEIGRASIAKKYRNGSSLSLVWKGIGRYALLCKAKYIFGCASLPTVNPVHAFLMFHNLNEHHCSQWNISPKKLKPIRFGKKQKHSISNSEISQSIPPLLSSYLKAGAKVASLPSVDLKMKCSDLLTILDIDLMNEKFKRKYLTYV